MATTQELFTKVTGLTWDVESLIAEGKITKEKLAWLVPDGAMLEGDVETNRKRKETAEFLEAVDIDSDLKFSTADVEYDEEDPLEDDSSSE